jgi:hypothetical protein
MGTITLAEICDAIATVFGTATGMKGTQSYNELTEGIQSGDLPLTQVYPADTTVDCEPDARTERHTFGGAVRVKQFTILADVYCCTRSQLNEDMESFVDMTDAVIDVLEAQTGPTFFALAGIKAFDWRCQRGVITYAGAEYYVARFTLTIWVY